jgi:hypothetical protein
MGLPGLQPKLKAKEGKLFSRFRYALHLMAKAGLK